MDLDFNRTVTEMGGSLCFDRLQTLQLNIGDRCNLCCRHCHVQAWTGGTRLMTQEVMDKVIGFLHGHRYLTVDITGGCPELNPDFSYLIKKVCGICKRVMVRTNLSVFFEPGIQWAPQWYADHNVAIVASLPCYGRENVDRQRGNGVFDKSIEALQMLNGLGYGKGGELELDLVYNPGGAFLPGSQNELETEYKNHLNKEYGIVFDNLFKITNCPIGRFEQSLTANGKLDEYLRLLAGNFNRQAADNMMCKSMLSVDYRGVVYNCDFNQAVDMPVADSGGNAITIDEIEFLLQNKIEIVTGDHCFACTAGEGSSCTGKIV